MRRNLLIGLTTFALTLALFSAPGAIWWALALLVVAGVMAMAFVGFLFVCVCIGIYREQLRAAQSRPPWLPEIEPLPQTKPEPVEYVRGRNGKL